MLLDVNDRLQSDPTEAAVLAAVPDQSPGPMWSLSLIHDESLSLEAYGRDDGLFDAACLSGTRIESVHAALAAEGLRALLLDFMQEEQPPRLDDVPEVSDEPPSRNVLLLIAAGLALPLLLLVCAVLDLDWLVMS
jgi:hypothetical protein